MIWNKDIKDELKKSTLLNDPIIPMPICGIESFRGKLLGPPNILPLDVLRKIQDVKLDPRHDPFAKDWIFPDFINVDCELEWEKDVITGEFLDAYERYSDAEPVGYDENEEFQIVAPGFTRGISFIKGRGDKAKSTITLKALSENFANVKIEETVQPSTTKEIDNLLDLETTDRIKFVKPKKSAKNEPNLTSWARAVDANHIPPDFDKVVTSYAFEYPFELDIFQKQAVYHLEKGQSVFVAAHTSAGKTVVAEYTIALAQKHLTKAVYTSPIKALSNQKFRDFKDTFSDVGLLTGDVQLNPEGSCLIMTTEILRSMLYKRADLINDVEFVIFDEVHYVNDQERGVVWEEVIIMLPPHVTLIMLSATTPNTMEFADWVGRTKQKEIHVISTLKRPVPLEHHLYLQNELVKIVDCGKNFLDVGYKHALQLMAPQKETAKPGLVRTAVPKPNTPAGIFRGQKQDKNLWIELVYYLKNKSQLPAVVFTLSKRKCEENADAVYSMELNSSGEKSMAHLFLEASISKLKGSDAQLPQILRMRDLLSRGVAVHHSGLLPIMKEAVEILFSRGLVKVLFATETFAMGINMPAKTVVFSSIRKHDGNSFRNLLPGEYTQMAGRAGRRGLDATGTVIIVCPDEVPAEASLRTMILGLPTKLTSQFRLTYNMILNLLRVEAIRVEEMIKSSFSENAIQKNLPKDQLKLAENEAMLEKIETLDCVICEADMSEFYSNSVNYLDLGAAIFEEVLRDSKLSGRYFESGRIIIINSGLHRNVPAAILKISNNAIVCCFISNHDQRDELFPPCLINLAHYQNRSGYQILTVAINEIVAITSKKIKFNFNSQIGTLNYHPKDMEDVVFQLIEKYKGIKEDTVPLEELELAPFRLLDVEEKRLTRKAIYQRLLNFQCRYCPDLVEHYGVYHQKQQLIEKLAELKFKLSDGNMQLLPEYQSRVEVLKVLNYVDSNGTVLLKGRVACEINTTNELLTTELLFANVFAEYSSAEIIALLSAMVFQEKIGNDEAEKDVEENEHLKAGREKMIEMTKDLVRTQREHGLDGITMDQALGDLRFGLVRVVYEWASGRPFKDIMELTEVLEGSIVRCIVRLDETCRELKGAAKIMGDPILHKKMEDASLMIKRDICSASSLYL